MDRRAGASGLSLDLLKGFEAAARHLSFTRAAQELFLTQSAVSREIKTLGRASSFCTRASNVFDVE